MLDKVNLPYGPVMDMITKLMIERDYFETLRPLYSPKVNGIWIRFYERAGKVRNDIFFKLIGRFYCWHCRPLLFSQPFQPT